MSFSFVIPEINIGNGTPKLQFYKRGFNLGGEVEPSWQDIILHGNTALTLVNAKADGLNYLKLFGGTELLPETYLDTVTLSGGCEQRNLPVGYTQVEYIESIGRQYINPNVSGNVRWIITAQANAVKGSSQVLISSTENAAGGTWYGEFTTTGNWDVTSGGTNIPVTTKTTADLTFDDNGVRGTIGSTSVDRVAHPAQGNWIIFSALNNDSSVVYPFTGKLFDAKMYQNGVLVRNFIPAKNSSNDVGLYDTVTDTFFTNQGEGTFIAGANVTAPTPTQPLDIWCNNGTIKVSRNLFGNPQYISGSLNDEGVFSSSSSLSLNYFAVKPNTTYTFSFIKTRNSYYDRICGYQSQTESSFTALLAKEDFRETPLGTRLTITFTTTSTTNYIRGFFPSSLGFEEQPSLTEGQLETGSVATTYRPYGQIYTDGTQEVVTDNVGNTANAEMLLALDDYKDTQEVLGGNVNRNVGVLVLDGSEEWENNASSLYSLVWEGMEQDKNIAPLCTHFVGVSTTTLFSDVDYPAIRCGWWASNSARDLIYIKDTSYASLDDFKSWLASQYASGTPVIVVYPLATATSESVSGQSLSKSPVTQTAGAISNLGIAATSSSHTTPTPQQPLDINCNNGVLKVSKNLLDMDNANIHSGYIGSSVGEPIRWGNSTITNTIVDAVSINVGESYTFSSLNNISGVLLFCIINNGVLQQKASYPISANRRAIGSITATASGQLYIQYVIAGQDFQLEKGSTATPYQPYVEGGIYTDGTVETVEINTTGDTATAERLLKVGTYQDVQSVLDGEVTRNIGVKVFDGTENFNINSSTGYSTIRGTSVLAIQGGTNGVGYCTHYKCEYANTVGNFYFSSDSSHQIVFIVDNATTLEQFKQFLADQYNAGTPVIIVYPVQTPTEETVTAQPLTIQAGTNIVSITQASMDDLELEVSYKAGVSVTITEVQNAQLDNNVEVTING